LTCLENSFLIFLKTMCQNILRPTDLKLNPRQSSSYTRSCMRRLSWGVNSLHLER
jgi:hypothetical protein